MQCYVDSNRECGKQQVCIWNTLASSVLWRTLLLTNLDWTWKRPLTPTFKCSWHSIGVGPIIQLPLQFLSPQTTESSWLSASEILFTSILQTNIFYQHLISRLFYFFWGKSTWLESANLSSSLRKLVVTGPVVEAVKWTTINRPVRSKWWLTASMLFKRGRDYLNLKHSKY